MAEDPRIGVGTHLELEGDVEEALGAYARGEYFDAHEAFERAWRASGEPRSLELHALAQWAAAAHKHATVGKASVVRAIAERAREKLARVTESAWNIDVRALAIAIGAFLGGGELPPIERRERG